MPTHKIHIAVANKVNTRLNYDLDSIILGSVMPDICVENRDGISHYQNNKQGIENVANPDLFVKKYKRKLKNPIIMGYLIHLLTDNYYNSYIYNKFYIFDENGNEIGLRFKNGDKYLPKSVIKDCKHSEFYLYDKWLLYHGYIPKFNNFDCLDNVINLEIATFDKNILKQYMIDLNKEIDNINVLDKIPKPGIRYKLTTKKELDKLFNSCCNYILNYIKNINIK